MQRKIYGGCSVDAGGIEAENTDNNQFSIR